MKKRLLSLVLSLAMMLTMLPATVWAEEDVTTLATVADTEITVVSGGNEADNDALFMDYLYRLAGADQTEVQSFMVDSLDSDDYETISHPAMMTASNFSPTSAAFYSKLKEGVEAIAAGGGSTVVNIVFSKTYTAEELNVPRVNILEGVSGAMERFHQDTGISYTQNGNLFSLGDDLDTEAVLNEIVFTDPISLYWYDKTVGSYIQKGYRYSWDKNVDDPQEITIEVNAIYYMCVATEFRPNPAGYYQLDGINYYCEVDASKTTAAKSAVAAAQGVVEKNKNGSDSEKLRAYLDYICGAVSYNSTALSNTPYGNPWQLIYVFDNKSSTNVVCEGYAKAFKFLCDLTEWEDKEFDCRLATGTMSGGTGAGPHMWNIVHIGGNNYLVDPTNCDTGTIGAPDKLFLREWEKGTFTYSFTNPTISYTYDDTTKSTFLPEELMLKGEPSLLWQWGYLENGAFVPTNESPTNEFEVELYQEFRGRLIFRDPEGNETVLHPTTEGLSIEPEDFLTVREYDPDTGFLCLAAVAPGEAIISYGGVELMVHSAIPPVGFYKTTELGEDDYLGVWDYDGVNTTVYLASTDENIVLEKVAPADETVIVGEKTGNCFPVTVNDLHSSRITLYLSGSVRDGERWETVEDQEIELQINDVRPGLVWHWLDDREGSWQETGVDRYWEEWLGNEPMGYLYYRDANGDETQLSDEEVAALSFEGLQYGLERDEGDSHSRIHLLFDRVGYAAISLPEGQEGVGVAIRVMAPEIGFYADAEGKEPIGLWVLDGSSDTVYLRWAEYIQVTAVERDDGNGNVTKIEMHPEEHYAAVTLEEVTDDWLNFSVTAAYTDPDRPEGDEPSSLVGIRVLDRRPGLRFYWVEGDWYDERVDGVREDDPQSRLVMSPGNTQMIQLAVFDGEKYQIVSEGITLPEGLLTLEKTVDGKYPVLTAVGFGSGEISCTVGNNIYTLPVDITLPQVGFYSKPEASKENYLTDWVYVDGQEDGFYLLWPEGTTLDHWVVDDHSRTRIEVDDSAADDGYLMIRITAFEDDGIGMEVFFRRDDGNVDRDFAWLTIQDRSPGVGLYHVDGNWDNEDGPFTVEEEPLQKTMYMTPNGTALIQVLFDDGNGTVTALKASDVTVGGSVKLHKTVGQGAYLVLEAGSVGEGYVAYTVQGVTYQLTVHVELPDLGFYSSPEATEDTYLNEWIYTGEDAAIYLICRNGTLTGVTGADDNFSGVSATILEGGKAAEIQLTELPDEGHLDVHAEYTRNDGASDHGDASVGFLMPQLVVNLSLPEGVSDAAVILWDKEGTAALESQPEMRRIGSMAVFPSVGPGEYRLTVEHQGCATRTYAIDVTQGKVTVVDAVVTALGDLNGSRETDISDMACLYDWLYLGKYTGALASERDYFRAVADVNEDGYVNILDYQALYEMVKAQ